MNQKLGKRRLLLLVGSIVVLAIGGLILFVWLFMSYSKGKSAKNDSNQAAQRGDRQGKTSVLDKEVVRARGAAHSSAHQDKSKQPEDENSVVDESNSTATGNETISSSKGGNLKRADDQGIVTNQLTDSKQEIKFSDSKNGSEDSKKIVADDEKGSSDDISKSIKLKHKNEDNNDTALNGLTRFGKFVAEATQMLQGKKVQFDALSESRRFDWLLIKFREAKSFEDVSLAINTSYSSDSADDQELNKELNVLHLKTMALHFQSIGESESVVKALKSLADHVSGIKKLSSYECAEAWGKVIMNVKDVEVLQKYYETVNPINKSVLSDNQFPNELFEPKHRENFNLLRTQHQDKTATILSAKSTKEVLPRLTDVLKSTFDQSTALEINTYFTSVSLLFRDPEKRSLFANLCPPPPQPNEDNIKLPEHIRNVLNKDLNVRRPQGFNVHWSDLLKFLKTPHDVIENLKAENEDAAEIQKWIEYAADYELLMASGLKYDEHEAVFIAYRQLQASFTVNNLSQFLDLILKGPDDLKLEWIGELVGYNCAHTKQLISDIVKTVWNTKNPELVATIVMKIRNEECNPMLNIAPGTAYVLPFLFGILDDDFILSMLAAQDVSAYPSDFKFKETPAFKAFLESLKAFFTTLNDPQFEHYEKTKHLLWDMRNARRVSDFAPSIGFLQAPIYSYMLKRHLHTQTSQLIKAYRELAKVIDSSEIRNLMDAEAHKSEMILAGAIISSCR